MATTINPTTVVVDLSALRDASTATRAALAAAGAHFYFNWRLTYYLSEIYTEFAVLSGCGTFYVADDNKPDDFTRYTKGYDGTEYSKRPTL